MPGWSLNTTVDELLKKEFDSYRDKKSHIQFSKNIISTLYLISIKISINGESLLRVEYHILMMRQI